MLKNAQRSTFNAQVSVQNLECGDKSCAVRGSRHRFPSALCAETHLVLALSRLHLVPTLSRLRQRRSVSTKCVGRSVGTKCRDVWPAAPLSQIPCHHTRSSKAASRGIPLAAALQIFSPDLRSRRYTVKISASPRLCVIKKCNAICGRVNKHALNGLAVAVCLLFISACRTPAPEAGRYQWFFVPRDANRTDRILVADTVTGEVAEWDGVSWSFSNMAPLSTPDWEAIRAERESLVKQRAEQEKQAKEAREKRVAIAKQYAQMPLEKQVAWAEMISVVKVSIDKRLHSSSVVKIEPFEFLKREGGLDPLCRRQSYKATDEGLAVRFNGVVDGESIVFCLSPTPMPNYRWIFAAPSTIIDDVKAEIRRQEERQKGVHEAVY